MKRIFYLVFAIALITNVTYSQELVKKADASDFIDYLPAYHKLNIEQIQSYTTSEFKTIIIKADQAEEIFNTSFTNLTISNFPVSSSNYGTLNLKRTRSSYAEDAKTIIATGNGDYELSEPDVQFYEGYIDGETDSKVYISYSNGDVLGMIKHSGGETFNISPIFQNEKDAYKGSHNLFRTGIQKGMDDIKMCGTDMSYNSIISEKELEKIKFKDEIQKSDLLEVNLVLESTIEYQYFFASNNEIDTTRARNYMIAVIDLASKIYQEYVNVTFNIIEIKMFFGDDPYEGGNLLSDKLNMMPNARNDRPANRALTVLFANLSAQQGGSFVAGIAMGSEPYKGNICNNSRGYCVLGIKGDGRNKYPTFDLTWDVTVACHEMGHLFSAPHTHNVWWNPAIDTCVTKSTQGGGIGDADPNYNGPPKYARGTIMSYCHLTNGKGNVELKFHTRMMPLLRSAVEINSPCVKPMQEPSVKILYPLGQNSFKGITNVDIRWTTQSVSKVDIDYSSDEGENWNNIVKNWNASDTIFNWQLPKIESKRMLVKVASSTNSSVNDISILPFEIAVPFLDFNSPTPGSQFGHLSKMSVKWTTNIPGKVRLEYSTDNGETWSTIVTGLDGDRYTWDIPDELTSDNVILRVVKEDNEEVFSISSQFSVGAEYVKITYPNLSVDQLCINPEVPSKHYVLYEYKYIDKVHFYTSLDGGNTWKKETIVPKEATGSLEWSIIGEPQSNVMVKLTHGENADFTLDTSDEPFSFILCAVSAGENAEFNSDLSIVKVSPNPVYNTAAVEVEYTGKTLIQPSFKLVDMLGNEISKLNTGEALGYGMNYFDITIPEDLSTGSYYIILNTGSASAVYPVKIVK